MGVHGLGWRIGRRSADLPTGRHPGASPAAVVDWSGNYK
jgi:hypothetical protein